MKKTIKMLSFIVLISIVLLSCGIPTSVNVIEAQRTEVDSGSKELSRMVDSGRLISTFDFDQKTIEVFLNSEENQVYSPINLYIDLSMLSEICSGETQMEIMEVLGCNDKKKIRQKVSSIINENCVDEDSTKIANSVWLSDRYEYNKDMLNVYANKYYASTFIGPMGSDYMNNALRSWVNDTTGDELLNEASDIKTDPSTLIRLLSVVYFHSVWKKALEFEENNTSKETFHGYNGDVIVDMMHNEIEAEVYETDEFIECDLELENGKARFFCPKAGIKISKILDGGSLVQALHRNDEDVTPAGIQKVRKVLISIPRFDVHGSPDVISGLEKLGIKRIFDPALADISGIVIGDESEDIYVSDIDHKAVLCLDEHGVTGAAYTDIDGAEAAPPPDDELFFVLNHPFLYAITGKDDSVLFAGTVYDL